MHRTRVMAVALASLLSGASVVGAQTVKPGGERATRAMGRGMDGARGGLLRGIALSDSEKTKIKAIHGTYREDAKAIQASLKPAMAEARAARQKGGSVAMKAVVARTAGDREKLRALMAREKAEIRGALSAEHQLVFDKNVRQIAKRGAKAGKMRRGEKGGVSGSQGRRAHKSPNA